MNKIIAFFIGVILFATGVQTSYALIAVDNVSSTRPSVEKFEFTTTMRYGMRNNNEVVQLQQYLINKGYLKGTADGLFYRGTHNAVKNFQKENGLTPDGIVGKGTRVILNSGVIVSLPQTLTVLSPNGGENWAINSTHIISWNTNNTDPNVKVDIYLETYRAPTCPGANGGCGIDLGDPSYILDKNVSNSIPYNWIVGTDINNQYIPSGFYGVKVCNTRTNICDYSNNYFEISNGTISPPKNTPAVVSPNGGENLVINSTKVISWNTNSKNRYALVDLYLEKNKECPPGMYCVAMYSPTVYVLDKNISNSSPYNWIVGTDTNNKAIPAGDGYTLKICTAGTNDCDYSDGSFTLTNGTITQPSVTVLSPNGGENLVINSTKQITWNVPNANSSTKVDLYLETSRTINCLVAPCPAIFGSPTYILDRNVSNLATYNWIVGTDINNHYIPSDNYGIKACIAGTNNCDYSDGSFKLDVIYSLPNN